MKSQRLDRPGGGNEEYCRIVTERFSVRGYQVFRYGVSEDYYCTIVSEQSRLDKLHGTHRILGDAGLFSRSKGQDSTN